MAPACLGPVGPTLLPASWLWGAASLTCQGMLSQNLLLCGCFCSLCLHGSKPQDSQCCFFVAFGMCMFGGKKNISQGKAAVWISACLTFFPFSTQQLGLVLQDPSLFTACCLRGKVRMCCHSPRFSWEVSLASWELFRFTSAKHHEACLLCPGETSMREETMTPRCVPQEGGEPS